LPYDILLAETDPELVRMEMDLYWITKGGQDPLMYFDRYPGRFPLVHVKDMDDTGGFADVGSGRIDFARIFARSETAGIRHYLVEHDNPRSPMDSIEASHRYLRELRF
jgi:sugar phosphate isomerase/epimerase